MRSAVIAPVVIVTRPKANALNAYTYIVIRAFAVVALVFLVLLSDAECGDEFCDTHGNCNEVTKTVIVHPVHVTFKPSFVSWL